MGLPYPYTWHGRPGRVGHPRCWLKPVHSACCAARLPRDGTSTPHGRDARATRGTAVPAVWVTQDAG
ncbi:MAG: hypothetical protein KatS3mg110_4157 [Pirellulaceae bacterium]|nr:MAG: hypothetical protein KatS3mg110_4157 [Pirellulaceae bacterium]